MPNHYTPRKDLTPEQRQAGNNKKRDSYNERKGRRTAEGGIQKTGHGGRGDRGDRGGGRGGRGGRGGSSSSNDSRCFRCGFGNDELELLGHGAAVRQFPLWCPRCGYLRNDRTSSQRLELVMENNELVLRPARQSLTAPAPGQALAVSPYAASSAATQSQLPPFPATPASGEILAFAERMFDRTLSALSEDRQQYLTTINMMADRLSSAQQPPTPQQALPHPAPQQDLPPPAPQHALPAPPQPLAIRPSPTQDPLAVQRLELVRSMSLNSLEQAIVAQTNNLSKKMQSSNAAQQAYRANGDGQWADRLGSISDIMNEWLQSHHQIAARHRNQIQHGEDSEIAAALGQFNMEKDTAAVTYLGKCQTKAASWSTTMDEISNRINAAINAPQQSRQIEPPMDARTTPPSNIVHYHDNRQDVRNLTYHAPSHSDTTMTGVPQIEGPQLSTPRRLTEFAGQQHPDLQTDEDMRQRQSQNLPYDDDQL